MRKSKHGPALFDVLQDEGSAADGPLKVPGWWSGERQRSESASRDSAAPEIDSTDAGVMEPPASAERRRPVPFVELEGDRIRFSLSSFTAAVAVFCSLVVVLGSFEFGSRSGERRGRLRGYQAGRESYSAEVADEIEIARSQPPETHLVSNLLRHPVAAATGIGGAGEAESDGRHRWIRGHTYIVAQEFSADRSADAERVQTYLAERGISTVMVGMPGGSTQLITTQGFNHNDPTQKELADRLLTELHRAGAGYYADGGGYKLQGYFKTLRGNEW